MKPLQKRYNTSSSTPNPQLGAFYSPNYPKKTRAELTTELASSLTQKKIINQLATVNKLRLMHCQSTNCKPA
ncbi:MAG TPA: hypothetical protein VIN07_06495, partial [Flavipsychrobacter sp.]